MIKPYSSLILLALLFPSALFAEKLIRSLDFGTYDPKETFCGSSIDARVCKCAFHNDFCKDIGKTRNEAKTELETKFNAFVENRRAYFIAQCLGSNGTYNEKKERCEYYEQDDKEKKCLPVDFDISWEKYSDIDPAIPDDERSYEAKRYVEAFKKLSEVTESEFFLNRDFELARLMQEELLSYKEALVKGLKTNLLKSFWRVAWMSYDAVAGSSVPTVGYKAEYVQGAFDLGRSYAKLFTEADAITHVGVGLKLLRSFTPENSRFAINTKETAGKMRSAFTTGVISTLEAATNPQGAIDLAKELFQDVTATTLIPDAKFSDEELAILRDQHLKNKLIDDALQKSYRANHERRQEIERLQQEREQLLEGIVKWSEKEKERVVNAIIDSCNK